MAKDTTMVYQVPARQNVQSSLPLIKSGYVGVPRYSLFKKVDGRWFQIRTTSYIAEMACRVWADFIASNPKVYSIRKASFDYNEAR